MYFTQQEMGPLLSEQPLSATTPWVLADPDVSAFGKQLREVAKLIRISKKEQFVEVFAQPALSSRVLRRIICVPLTPWTCAF